MSVRLDECYEPLNFLLNLVVNKSWSSGQYPSRMPICDANVVGSGTAYEKFSNNIVIPTVPCPSGL